MPSAFLIQPLHRELESARIAIEAAAEDAGFSLLRADRPSGATAIVDQIYACLESADLVIADLSLLNPNAMYELGFAHGARRPVILISSESPVVPFDIASVRMLHYGRDLPELEALQGELAELLELARHDPAAFSRRPETRHDVDRLFISYSHKDRSVLDRLMVHLKPLEREGLVDAWNDTRIEAGADWKREVENSLGHARAAILLVTADFLASDFIVENELPPLLHNAESKGTSVIPLIVKPCRYTRDASLRRLQAINDPAQPLLSLNEVEQERVLDSVAIAVEKAMRPIR
jgi:hypothetical protein